MPSKDELPPGPLRAFVEELHLYFRDANLPDLARIVTAITALPDAPPVSRETVRRLLRGKTTSKWEKVDALFRALCQMAGRNPDLRRWEEQYNDEDETTQREHLRNLWSNVVAGAELEASRLITPPRKPEPPTPTTRGGWGTPQRTSPSTPGYSDEPPF